MVWGQNFVLVILRHVSFSSAARFERRVSLSWATEFLRSMLSDNFNGVMIIDFLQLS